MGVNAGPNEQTERRKGCEKVDPVPECGAVQSEDPEFRKVPRIPELSPTGPGPNFMCASFDEPIPIPSDMHSNPLSSQFQSEILGVKIIEGRQWGTPPLGQSDVDLCMAACAIHGEVGSPRSHPPALSGIRVPVSRAAFRAC